MDFSAALKLAKAGKLVQRPHMHDEHTIEDHSEQLKPHSPEHPGGVWTDPKPKHVVITSWVHWPKTSNAPVLHTVDGREMPYHADPADLAADDWRECTASPSTAS
jgi:hypothetical protein